MGFSDYEASMKMRDVINKMIEVSLDRLRPEPRTGEVYDFDVATMTCDVLYPGETTPLKVKISRGQVPHHKKMDLPDGSATGDIVRVAGRLGNYYVLTINDYSGSVDSLPVGIVLEYGGTTAPAGYLMAQGAFVDISDYPTLFSVYGHTYNGGTDPGDGTFKLPDKRDRAGIGASGTHALGTTGGAAAKAITTSELPAHTHAIDHDHASATSSSDAHSHDFNVQWSVDVPQSGSARRVVNVAGTTGGSGTSSASGSTSSDSHSHTVNLPNHTGSSGSAGSGNPLDIQNPYQAMNFIIKY